MSGNCSLASAPKIFLLWFREPRTTRQGSVGLWHGRVSGGVEALGLGWLHAGMGWEASSGSEGAGEPPAVAWGHQSTEGDGAVLGQQETPKSPCQFWAVVPVPKQARALSAGARLL